MKKMSCPSCGGQIEFRAGNSVVAICGYCTMTVYRDGEELRNIGKMASLMDDASPLQLGTEGKFLNRTFTIIGRIQLKYDAGLWNEWHIMFSDNSTGWLGEAMGEFILTMEKPLQQIPDPSHIEPGATITINGEAWQVSDIQDATCIAGEGELPFQVGAGYEAPTVDLRRDATLAGPAGLTYATLDYSDDPVRFYLGQTLTYKELRLTNLRQDVNNPWLDEGKGGSAAPAKTFHCINCGSPLTRSDKRISTIGCPACSAVLDVSSEEVQLLQEAQRQMDTPLLVPLGSKGKLNDVQWDVIGHMRRSAHDAFSWSEYLLHNPQSGFSWLIESSGHWTHMKLRNPPGASSNQDEYKVDDLTYKQFDEYPSQVDHVLGEFYWRVRKSEEAYVKDYIAPPMMLSRELMDKEMTWSIGQYLEPAVVQEAFKLKTALPEPTDVAPNQPNPHTARKKTMWRWFRWLFVIALALQLFYACSSRTLLDDTFNPHFEATLESNDQGQLIPIPPDPADAAAAAATGAAAAASAPLSSQPEALPPGMQSNLSKPFKVSGRGVLALKVKTDVTNASLELYLTLVNTKTGERWERQLPIEYYEGSDDGESWKEGSREGEVYFNGLTSGEYQLQTVMELASETSQQVSISTHLERQSASWLNWILMTLFLLSFPLIAWWRHNSFESKRWAQSGYKTVDDDDDDD